MRYKCKNCGYHFESKEKKEKCPYCGETNGLTIVGSAEELVKEKHG